MPRNEIRVLLLPGIGLLLCASALTAQAQPLACQRGAEAYDRHEYAAASAAFTECLHHQLSDETRENILEYRAYSLLQTGEPAKAALDQRAALSIKKPPDLWPFIMLSVYQREAGQYDNALATLKSAGAYSQNELKRPPGPAVFYHAGRAQHQAGRFDEAVIEYSKAIEKQPGFGETYFYRALSYEAIGDRHSARNDLEEALRHSATGARPPGLLSKASEYGLVSSESQR